MNPDPRLVELDMLAAETEDPDSMRILDLMTEVGQDAAGLGVLVERYANSENEDVRAMLALVVNRACWVWDFEDERLPAIVYDFVRRLSGVTTNGTLSTALGAIQGLDARQLLPRCTSEERAVVSGFFRRCVQEDDWLVLSTAVYVLSHLHLHGVLDDLLSEDDRTAIRRRLRELQGDPDYESDLEVLKDFWAEQ